MKSVNESALQWLDLDVDGVLAADDQTRLSTLEAADPALAEERRLLLALRRELAADRIPVRADFTDQVLAHLPIASWETRSSWRLPVALLVGFATAAALLLAGSNVLSAGAMGTALAVVDLFQAAALAGSGLLGATWRGSGLALGEWLAVSEMNWVTFGAIVLTLNLLFVRLLRRRTVRQSADSDAGGAGRAGDGE